MSDGVESINIEDIFTDVVLSQGCPNLSSLLLIAAWDNREMEAEVSP